MRRRLGQLARETPAERERYLDLLRALAIAAVVIGHWLIIVIDHDRSGRLTGRSALVELSAARPGTWLFQVMPIFFLVGGYANAASLSSHRRRGGRAVDWLLDRCARLLRPTTALIVVLAGAALGAQLVGADAEQVRPVVWFATIPLWFLAAYLAVVALTPVTYALHRRFGLAVPVALLALVVGGDLARLVGPESYASGNFLFGWLAVHQFGYAWRDSRTGTGRSGGGLLRTQLPMAPTVGVGLLFGGFAALLALTLAGPYPVSMVNIPGERLHNMSPPSLALLANATWQLGVILLLRGPAERWLHRPRPWLVVIAANAVVLTIFLWHITAAVLLVGALDALDALPTPAVGSGAWWLWRLPWLVTLTVVLAVLVAVFSPIETGAGRRSRFLPLGPIRSLRPTGRPLHRLRRGRSGAGPPARLVGRPERTVPRAVLTGVGIAAVVAALLDNSLTSKDSPEPVGLPTAALVSYLTGAAVLRWLRSRPDRREAPPAPTDT
ncbi:acyltransferase family protein [Micromonospora sp. NBC_01796]|uniref:acyltransferase family protein n=1 Tax=Micromonospora sp. NBC_01796 TaxID=2975987 RepID=UPI002DD94F7D|nr:acyltransferase [Micromonospora sp. NBC_01796]WSA83747.1 acyltransferase [Micromonospora sp. NBC_01796]